MVLKDGQPFQGATSVDYAGSATQTRFLDMINTTNGDLTLNPNLNITD